MNLKRILNLFLLATLSLFMLSACSDDSEGSSTRTSSSYDFGNVVLTDVSSGGNTNSDVEDEVFEVESETNTEDIEIEDTEVEDDIDINTDVWTEIETEIGSDSTEDEDEGVTDTEDEGAVVETTQEDDEYEFNLLYAKAASYLALLGLDYCANNTFDENSYPKDSCASALKNLDTSLISDEDYYSEFTSATNKDSDFYKEQFLVALYMYLEAAYKVKDYANTWDTSLLTTNANNYKNLATNISEAEYHYNLMTKANLARGVWGGSDTSVKHIYNFTAYAAEYISQIVYGSISLATHRSSVLHYAGEVGYYVHRVLKNVDETGNMTSNVSSMIVALQNLEEGTEGGNTGDEGTEGESESDTDSNTETDTETETETGDISEECYQYKIASAFYNAAEKLVNAVDYAFTNSSNPVDENSITGATEDYEEAYELVKGYISQYNLSRYYNTKYSVYVMWKYGELEDVLNAIDNGFASLDSASPNENVVNYLDTLSSDVAYPLYIYLLAHVVESDRTTSDYQEILDDFPAVVKKSYEISAEVIDIFSYSDYLSSTYTYKNRIESYLATAEEALLNLDSNSCGSNK